MGGDGEGDEAPATGTDMLTAADPLIGAAAAAVVGIPCVSDDSRGGGDQGLLTSKRPPLLQLEAPQTLAELLRQQHEQRRRLQPLEMKLFVQKAVQLQAEVHCKHLQNMIDQRQPAASSVLASSRAASGCSSLMVGGTTQAGLLDGRDRSSGGAGIGGAGGGVNSREGSTVVAAAPAEVEPPGAADTAAKASSCSGGGGGGGHGGARYRVATGRGPPMPQPSEQPLPSELSQVMERLAVAHGHSWSFRVVREVVRPHAAAVLAEVTVGAATRQQWGAAEAAAVAAGEGGDDIGIVLLPAATAQALANAALLFLPSAGLPAFVAVKQPAVVPHSSAVQKEAAVDTAALSVAATAAAASAMQDGKEQASPTCAAPSTLTFGCSSPTLGVNDVNSMAQLNGASARLSPRDPMEGAATHLPPPALLPTALATTSSGGQLAGSIDLRSSAAETQALEPMPASADPLLDAPTTAAGLPVQPPLPPGSSSSGGASVLIPGPRLSSSSPSVQNPQLVCELPSNMSLLPTGPRGSATHALDTNTGSKLSSSSSLTTARSPASGPSSTPGLKVLVTSDGPDSVRNVEHALDKYYFDVPELGIAQVEYEVMAWANMIHKLLEGEKIDALLLHERFQVINGSNTCQLVRQYELEHNLPEMPIIGISAKVKRADLIKYAMSGYSAILGKHINGCTAGKWLRNYVTTYKPPSKRRRAQLKLGDVAEIKKPMAGGGDRDEASAIGMDILTAPAVAASDPLIGAATTVGLVELQRQQHEQHQRLEYLEVRQPGATAHAGYHNVPPGAADTAAKASSCSNVGGAGGHGGGRYGVATGRGPTLLQPLPSELSQVMDRLALAHGDLWSFRVVREIVRPRAAAVLAEVTVGAATRQQWGAAEAAAVAAGEGGDDIGVVLLPAATAQALANAALLFLPSAGLSAVEAVKQPAAAPHSSAAHKDAVVETAALPAAEVAATAAMEDRKEQASPTCEAPSRLTVGCLSPTPVVNDVKHMAQLNVARFGGFSPIDPRKGWLWHPTMKNGLLPTAVAMMSSGGQLAGSIGLRLSAAEAQAQGPMPASADHLLDAPTTAAGLPLQPPLPPGSSSSGGSSVLVPGPCLSPSSPAVQNPQLVCELPSDSSLLPTIPLASSRHAPNTNTDGKFLSSSSMTTAQSPALGHVDRRIEFEVVTGADLICKILEGLEKIDALLLDERFKAIDGSNTCQLVRQHEVDRNLPEMPIIGISANVKRADLEEYAKSGYSAVLGNLVNERTVGKSLCNYLTTYRPPSTGRRAQLERGGIVEVKQPFNGFIAFKVIAVALGLKNYSFPAADKVKKILADPSKMAGGGDRDEASATGTNMLSAPAFAAVDPLIGAATTAGLVELQRQQHEQHQRPEQLEVRKPGVSQSVSQSRMQALTALGQLRQPRFVRRPSTCCRRWATDHREGCPSSCGLPLLQLQLQLREQMTLQLQKAAQRNTCNLQYMIDQQELAASSALASSRAAGGRNALMVGGKAQADLLDGRGTSSSGASIGGAGDGVKSREAVAPAETEPPVAANTAAKASSCSNVGGAGDHGGGRYGVATGRGPPVLQPLPSELSQVMERLALEHGNSWSFRVLREVVRPRSAAVPAEVTVGAVTRQHWGAAKAVAVAAGEGGGDIGIVLLPAATAQALANAALLFLPSAELPAVEAVKQPAVVPRSSKVQKKAAAEVAAAWEAAVVAVAAGAASMQDGEEQASPTSADLAQLDAPRAGYNPRHLREVAAMHWHPPTAVVQVANSMAQLYTPSADYITHHLREAAAMRLAHAAYLPTVVAKTSSGGQLAGSIGLRLSAAEAQAQGPMPASADPLLDASTTAAGLPLQPLLPSLSFGSLSSGGSSGLVPAPCLSPSSPSVQDNPQPELPSDVSLLPTGHLASSSNAPNTNTGSKLSSSTSLTTAQSPASGPSRTRTLKILVTSDGPDNVRDVEHALDKYCLDAPQLGNAQVEFEVVAWADVICKILRGEKIGALLLDERLKAKTGFYTCQLVRQYEVDHNCPQMPIIGISATVKRADLERYATSGYSAIWGYSINEYTAGKMCNYLTTYKPPSKKRRAEMKRGDIVDFTRPFNGFMAFI
eukprot:SM000199S05416  [mRNA]  locus=s199:207688:224910:+ [translate_table: standard]